MNNTQKEALENFVADGCPAFMGRRPCHLCAGGYSPVSDKAMTQSVLMGIDPDKFKDGMLVLNARRGQRDLAALKKANQTPIE